jgi:hypothetical protein
LPGVRYFLCGEQITSVNDLDNVFYRIDMPGHIKHKDGDTFSQVYLSYHGKIPADDFKKDFAPDANYLYQRQEGKVPERMIRAYQIKVNHKPGLWLAGMTLDAGQVYEAWCHQRGYVCMIEELHGRKIKAGEAFGAAYVVGYFDSIAEMETVYDRFKGKARLSVKEKDYELKPLVSSLHASEMDFLAQVSKTRHSLITLAKVQATFRTCKPAICPQDPKASFDDVLVFP